MPGTHIDIWIFFPLNIVSWTFSFLTEWNCRREGYIDRCMEKKGADIDAPTGLESFASVTVFYSHINFTIDRWVSSLYTEGHEAQWACGWRRHEWWSTQTSWIASAGPTCPSLPTCGLCFLWPTPATLVHYCPRTMKTLCPTVGPKLKRMEIKCLRVFMLL